jgi:hypothetical protein
MGLLTTWLIAAFFAAVLSFAPNSAFAHEGHAHHGAAAAPQGATAAGGHDAVRIASASASPSPLAASSAALAQSPTVRLEKAFVSVKPSAVTAVMTGEVPSSCNGKCCNLGCGAGCCAAVFTIAESLNPRPVQASSKLRPPSDLAVAGNRPSSLLEPPAAFA